MTVIMIILVSFAFLSVEGCGSKFFPLSYFRDKPKKAVVVLTGENVNGILNFSQEACDCPITISGEISGLSKGLHGFHVHEYGDITNGCTSAGSHFNPFELDHGGPSDKIRHVGDLGNVEAGNDGVANVQKTDRLLSLYGPQSILGRAVVVHANQDDLGRGGHELSKTSGNAGGRVACGVISISQ
ncbi:uncharacterized protein LOC143250653 [Tachypleus tridentatus]|uniref:uncharacterized protein LOC143250653 n=1 Tax=Tachypleus tridentatus TaxID=6853 RepID=UPI003FD34013